jgi:hypothetical protein
MRFNIKDETVHAAFDLLESHAQPAAAARAMRERCDDQRRAARARGFLNATGNVAEREAQSVLTDEYSSACEAFYEAVEADEYHRNQRSKCEAIIEAWRTVQSNFRAMGKVA